MTYKNIKMLIFNVSDPNLFNAGPVMGRTICANELYS